MKIIVFENQAKKELTAKQGERLLDVLCRNHVSVPTDCGGIGLCKKCKVHLLCGSVDGQVPDADGFILSCKAFLKEPITIALTNENRENREPFEKKRIDKSHAFSLAFDLGTTTLAFSLVDINTKKRIASYSTLNPQKQFGADVISRISAANEGHLLQLHQLIIDKVNEAISYFKMAFSIPTIQTLAVAGNTTMLHLFLNVSPKSIGTAPYQPVFTEAKTLLGKELALDCETVQILPSFSAFVGADIASGAYACNLPSNAMLIDLGTNGELLYRKGERYFATSTAAGPCLEGATMDCGIGGVDGAISKVKYQNNQFIFSTIGNKNPCGICGAGYVDTIAALLKENMIDETGAISIGKEKIYITRDIYISDADIRKFQLAKSAISSGILSLLHEISIPIESIDAFYLAGGIGFYVDILNTICTGLLPKEVNGKVKVVGNSCLFGAEQFLYHQEAKKMLSTMTKHVEIIDLTQSLYFNNAYIENMMFL